MTGAPGWVELKELFQQHGFTPVKAELWSEFIEQVLGILRAAAEELRQSENWDAFKKKRGALGAPRARKRSKVIERVPIEDAITSELGHYIRYIRRSLPPGHFLRLNEVEFHVEDLVQSDARAGRHSRKVDFFIYAASGVDEPEFAIEAKPIVSQADIAARYLAADGIGCFLTTDSPYTRRPLGGMLAYTINAGGRTWRAEVRAAVGAYTPPVMALADVMVRGESEPMACSRHDRTALSLDPILILHLEMIFHPDSEEKNAE
ncbi:MAG: hypothetical protein WBB98_03595 [Xanthobacteraceae bacterium]